LPIISLGSYSAMALYRYVHSKDGLIDLMLDAATAEIALPDGPGQDWRARLHALAVATRQMTKRHPWYPALFHTRPPAGPHMMRRREFMLAVLTGRAPACQRR
jgi:AcrR family transcriptional regulator